MSLIIRRVYSRSNQITVNRYLHVFGLQRREKTRAASYQSFPLGFHCFLPSRNPKPHDRLQCNQLTLRPMSELSVNERWSYRLGRHSPLYSDSFSSSLAPSYVGNRIAFAQILQKIAYVTVYGIASKYVSTGVSSPWKLTNDNSPKQNHGSIQLICVDRFLLLVTRKITRRLIYPFAQGTFFTAAYGICGSTINRLTGLRRVTAA